MLTYKIDGEQLAALDDNLKSLYKEKDGFHFLEVEGATSKDKIDEFRTNNISLQDQLKKFDGVDLDKYTALQETERKLRNKELIDKGDFDTLLKEHTNTMQSDFTGKLSVAQAQIDELTGKNKSMVNRYEIEGAAQKAFSANHIRPEAQAAIMAQIKSTFTVNGESVVAMEGDNIMTGADGNLTVNEFVSAQPEFMKVPSEAGAGSGSESSTPAGGDKLAAKRAAVAKLVGKG